MKLSQVWLLGVCVLLCLNTGAYGIVCTVCDSEGPGKPCVPVAPYVQNCPEGGQYPASCILYRITSLETKYVLRYYKRCGFYTKECRTRKTHRYVKQIHELHCCNDKDQCL